jgi:hypothetical protein
MTMKRFLASVALTSIVLAVASMPVSTAASRYDARNADKVDGFDAVPSTADIGDRAGALVATNPHGRLPNGIVRKVQMASDSDRLDGYGAGAFVQRCTEGALRGWASVPADLSSDYSEVPGDGTLYGGAVNVEGGACHSIDPVAKRVAQGVYRVNAAFVGLGDCPGRLTDSMLAAVVTVANATDAPLVADYRPVCDQSGAVVAEVRIFDLSGTPVDSAFTIAVLRAQGDPIP